jgi:hypothetical protein
MKSMHWKKRLIGKLGDVAKHIRCKLAFASRIVTATSASLKSFDDFVRLLSNPRFCAELTNEAARSSEFSFLDKTISPDAARDLIREVLLNGFTQDAVVALPESESKPLSLRHCLREGICLPEFRRDFPLLLKRRGLIAHLLFHVHIEKCGGHALYALLAQNDYRAWHRRALEFCGWVGYVEHLAHFMQERDKPAYLVGHYDLGELLQFVNPGELLVIPIREPAERLISLVNFIFMVLEDDPKLSRFGVREFAQMLGGKIRPQDHTLEALIELPAVREKMMTQISRRLTVDNFARNSVVGATVIATDSLQRWVDECGSRQGLRGQVTRENVSKKFYRSDMLAPSAWKRLRLLMRDDYAYWELMKDSLGERGYGQIQISELAGLSRRD